MRANNVTDIAFIGLDVITAQTNIATAQRAMMTEKQIECFAYTSVT